MKTTNLWVQKVSSCARSAMVPFAMVAVWATNGAYPGLAQQSTQQTFPSTETASQSLFQAVQHNDGQTLAKILGGPAELASSRDEAQDKLERELFLKKYQEMHRLGRDADGSMTLYIGAENWPFPIPLIANNGAWHFDSEAGLKEVLFRRIGENELTAIAICHDFVAAEKQLRTNAKAGGQAGSPVQKVVSKSGGEAGPGGGPVLIHGYYIRMLATGSRTQGKGADGFAFIAYPAEYRSSGVMTFIVTSNDVVYEKDLGANT
ncbi:MAG: putative exported protein, partial [Bryobacterales bacterium]|nr:putative exported protein [Bryobacterales bacterium]